MDKTQYRRWVYTSLSIVRRTDVSRARSRALTRERRRAMCEKIKDYFRSFDFENDYGYKMEDFQDWDGNNIDHEGSVCLADYTDEYFGDEREWSDRLEDYKPDRIIDPVMGALKAGFDLVVYPSGGGVLGYTVKDVRRMFRGNVPGWVKDYFDPDDGSFDSFKDMEPVWL